MMVDCRRHVFVLKYARIALLFERAFHSSEPRFSSLFWEYEGCLPERSPGLVVSLLGMCASSGGSSPPFLTISMNLPKTVPKMWKNDEMMYQAMRTAKMSTTMDSRMFRAALNRMRCIEVAFACAIVMHR